jgi:hypothetical protein
MRLHPFIIRSSWLRRLVALFLNRWHARKLGNVIIYLFEQGFENAAGAADDELHLWYYFGIETAIEAHNEFQREYDNL